MGKEIPEALRATVHYQCGVIARRQAIAAGLSADTVAARVLAGRWQRVYRGVYATFTGPLSREARLWAAVLYAGPGAMLSHQTAGEFHRLIDRADGGLIHVAVPHGRVVRPAPGIVVHRCRYTVTCGFRSVRCHGP